MLVILKIPVVYLCAVVWWAIRAEPRPSEGAGTMASLGPSPGPEPGCDWRARRARVVRRGPLPRRGPPADRPQRAAYAHARVSV
jgi:hypothetical protein